MLYGVLFTESTFDFSTNSMVSVFIFRSHDYENFPCYFLDKQNCYAVHFVILFKAHELYKFPKTVVLMRLRKVNKSGKT